MGSPKFVIFWLGGGMSRTNYFARHGCHLFLGKFPIFFSFKDFFSTFQNQISTVFPQVQHYKFNHFRAILGKILFLTMLGHGKALFRTFSELKSLFKA